MNGNLWGLWPHQDEAVAQIETAWNAGIKSICYQAPTGSGKGRIIRTIVENHASSKKVIYIIVHRKNLVRQLSKEINSVGLKHGIIEAGSPFIKYRIQVASLQTIVRRLEKIPEPEIIIVDECHHIKSESYLRIINKWPEARLLGTSATPARLDGKPLSDIVSKLILGPSVRELIDTGFLSDFDYYAPQIVDMSGVHKVAGEYAKDEVVMVVDKKTITGSAVEHYKKYADHKPAIASCASIEHTEHVAEEFREAGYKAIAVHSGMEQKKIEDAIRGLSNGSTEILCQCELLGEGIDVPGATALIGLRPTASLVIHLQHIGRVLRAVYADNMPTDTREQRLQAIAEGPKKRAVILDHVGNWMRHDLPDDPHEWSLEGIEKREKGKLNYKRCPECLRPVKIAIKTCPYCGYLWITSAQDRTPTQIDGELVDVRGIMPIRGKDAQNKLTLEIARHASTLKQAIRIAKTMGQTAGQAWYVWVRILKNSA